MLDLQPFTHPAIVLPGALLLGLIVGSFLNVVIYRIPIMLQREWRQQCAELLEQEVALADDGHPPRFNLITPNSHCPQCDKEIKPWENIPLVSYLLLGGKCSQCKTPISRRYPLVELATGLLTLLLAWELGLGWPLALACLLVWSLVSLTMIDIDHQLLPDNITLPLLWLGLLANCFGLFTNLNDAVIGAAAGYLSLWSVFWLFKLLTGKEGMGYGDFKLLAALGAWMGWQSLPLIILLSSVVGAVLGILMMVVQGRDRATPIPFGPYLAIAGFIALLYGDRITQSYLQLLG
ncbi:prepilin peptidase [Aestuariirhabdus litorea]|uniref:Prepilin leader peptidase/N-methyltransferase n=1 Tax=Aestuariirhabdus litorea TaxID=2528527 RepID=A0A3P3VMH0_9GAMM|nr:A24 family peptidase [Aestuariirhabdus litorea]RRJ83885.1 prepilin peptidase [Aestuariirhabdus litorea]RWW97107.1 prepilin peptidase [Endozoicomonadaceae bacterium GTF-13]